VPKLSLILAARNDNYCGDSPGRLQITLNHAGVKLHEHDAEILVCDWGSRVPLREVLTLNAHAKEITRFHYIPRILTSQFPVQFSEVHALNSVARWAAGDFIGRIDQDTLIGERFVKWFYSGEPSERCFYWWSARRDMKKDQPLDLHESCRESLDRGEIWRTAVGIFLMPTRTYHDLRGYDERTIYKNHIEHEFFWRLKQVLEFVDLGKLVDYDFYHLWHDRADNKRQKRNVMLDLPTLKNLPLRPNPVRWGLQTEPGRLFSPQQVNDDGRN